MLASLLLEWSLMRRLFWSFWAWSLVVKRSMWFFSLPILSFRLAYIYENSAWVSFFSGRPSPHTQLTCNLIFFNASGVPIYFNCMLAMASPAFRLLSTPKEGLTSTISFEFVRTWVSPRLPCRAPRWREAAPRRSPWCWAPRGYNGRVRFAWRRGWGRPTFDFNYNIGILSTMRLIIINHQSN